MKTLERNDVDRPKRIREKYDIFQYYEPNLVNVPEVKNTVRDELKRRKHEKYLRQVEARQHYSDLLEYVHSRYDPERPDNPHKALEVSAIDAKKISEHKIMRLPVELERRFFEILFVIIEDNWELPVSSQWIELLEYLKAFNLESQLVGLDNELQDCFKFFLRASRLFGFEEEFRRAYQNKYDELREL